MGWLCGSRRWMLALPALILLLLQQGSVPVQAETDQAIMYFGFFFDDATASTIKMASDLYFNATAHSGIELVDTFLHNISTNAGLDSPLHYYSKPVDPNTKEDDPAYHITTKFCGRLGQESCLEYLKKFESSMNKTFQMELVGYFLTNRSFGIRINLVGEDQLELWASGEAVAAEENSASPTPSQASLSSELPGIIIEPLGTEKGWPLSVTSNKAHITLGCAPGIPAVITGPDHLKVIRLEKAFAEENENGSRQTWNNTADPLLPSEEEEAAANNANMNMTIAGYNLDANADANNVTNQIFVIYPRVKILANATFRPYYYLKSGGMSVVVNGGGPAAGTLSLLLLLLGHYLHKL